MLRIPETADTEVSKVLEGCGAKPKGRNRRAVNMIGEFSSVGLPIRLP